MSRKIEINPVTRIEGHAKITIQMNDNGHVDDAHIHVTQFRGFEKLAQGRPFAEMPSLMARTCGICPVAHLVAGAKACDEILAVRIPKTAAQLRELINMAQIIQSHALNFFHLSSPDFIVGMDGDPKDRNVFGLMKSHPDTAKNGIRLRQIGQEIINILGEKKIHPAWLVPGGVNDPLTSEDRDAILSRVQEGMKITEPALEWFKGIMDDFREEIKSFGNFPSLFMSIVDRKTGGLNMYDGNLRFVDSSGHIVKDAILEEDYQSYIGERVEPFSYLKSPYYLPNGYPEGIYRVGPLARLNVVDSCETPKAGQEWSEFKEIQRGAVLSSFYYHYARLIEILFCLEKTEIILNDPDILSNHVRAIAAPNNFEGVGIAEAPRGTLIHHYKIDENGLIDWVNLIIASGHNNLAMNRSVSQVAKHFVKGDDIKEGMLNRVEAVIRAYDPCLSCSTHAVGNMAMHIDLIDPTGKVVKTLKR